MVKNKILKAFTLVEMLVVVGIFTFVLAAIFSVLLSSNKSWTIGRTQQQLQQEVRKAISAITNDLRESSPEWTINGTTNYEITINGTGDTMTFYVPVYDDNDNITSMRGILYYLGAQNPNTQTLYKKIGQASSVAVATNIYNIASEKPFFQFDNVDKTVVNIKIPVIINNTVLRLTSKVTLRNTKQELQVESVEEPGEGEF